MPVPPLNSVQVQDLWKLSEPPTFWQRMNYIVSMTVLSVKSHYWLQ